MPYALPSIPSAALLILRLFVGYAFIVHGWGKIQSPMSWMPEMSPVPGILQALAAIAEFGGGIALILGLLTRLAAFGLTCTMAVATYMHLVAFGDSLIATKSGSSAEPAATYLVISILLLALGAGKFSIDRKIFGEK